jgi:carbon monoxide dehydrogenase subunit G
MSMNFSGERVLGVGVAAAWAALNDDAILKRCIPGCETLQRSEPDLIEATVALSIGPVKARFKGKVRFEDVQPEQGYRMVFEGQGGVAGFSKGTAVVRLSAQDDQRTLLTYDASAQVGGKIAQIGSRLVDAAAQKITGEFFSRFEKELASGSPSQPQPE